MSIISAALSGLRTARLITVCLAIAALATVSPNSARAEYPDHPVTIVACFPAGGGTDLAARMIHVELGKALGQPVLIENRGGAGGSIGTGVVARASIRDQSKPL
jgi:tripartite-type tricarboxylate transporter receptor subunit TctC